jgi:hypothetical protein
MLYGLHSMLHACCMSNAVCSAFYECVQLGHFRAALDDARASLVHSAGTFTKAYLRQGAALEGAHNGMQQTRHNVHRGARLHSTACAAAAICGWDESRARRHFYHSAHTRAYIRTHARSCSCRCAFSIWSGRLIFLVVLLDRIGCTVRVCIAASATRAVPSVPQFGRPASRTRLRVSDSRDTFSTQCVQSCASHTTRTGFARWRFGTVCGYCVGTAWALWCGGEQASGGSMRRWRRTPTAARGRLGATPRCRATVALLAHSS